jgi:hypothetical protein
LLEWPINLNDLYISNFLGGYILNKVFCLFGLTGGAIELFELPLDEIFLKPPSVGTDYELFYVVSTY